MIDKLVIIGPVSVHTENFIGLIDHSFREVVFIGEESINPKLVTRQYTINFRNTNLFRILANYRKMVHVLSSESPAVVHIHFINRLAYFAAKAIRKLNLGYIATAWGSDILLVPKQNFIFRKMIVSVLQSASCISTDSRQLIDEIVLLCPEIKNTELVFYGIEPIPAQKKKKIVYSNRLHEKLYNIDLIIKDFHAFLPENPGWRLVIAGKGSLTDELKGLVKKLNMETSVDFVGWLDNSMNRSYYSEAMIFASCPDSDGTAVSLLEAMSASCIPVVSDLPVSKEWINDNENGIIRKQGENNVFSRAVVLDQTNVAVINAAIIKDKATKTIASQKFIDIYNHLKLTK